MAKRLTARSLINSMDREQLGIGYGVSERLRDALHSAALSANRLAQRAHVDPSCVSRIIRGTRPVGSYTMLRTLMEELPLTNYQRREWAVAIGYCPPELRDTGWNPTYDAVTEVLTTCDPRVAHHFEGIVQDLARLTVAANPALRRQLSDNGDDSDR